MWFYVEILNRGCFNQIDLIDFYLFSSFDVSLNVDIGKASADFQIQLKNCWD